MVAELPTSPEFSRFVAAHELEKHGLELKIEADPQERETLAKRFDLLGIERLCAEVSLETRPGGIIHMHVHYEADVSQSCIVTLVPLKNRVAGSFERLYSAEAEPFFGSETEPGEDGHVSSEDSLDPPDPLVDEGIDIGEAVAEQLALEIDPFPRAENAEFEDIGTNIEDSGDQENQSPFAALRELKNKQG